MHLIFGCLSIFCLFVCSQMLSLLPTRTLRMLEFVGFSGNKVNSTFFGTYPVSCSEMCVLGVYTVLTVHVCVCVCYRSLDCSSSRRVLLSTRLGLSCVTCCCFAITPSWASYWVRRTPKQRTLCFQTRMRQDGIRMLQACCVHIYICIL